MRSEMYHISRRNIIHEKLLNPIAMKNDCGILLGISMKSEDSNQRIRAVYGNFDILTNCKLQILLYSSYHQADSI